MRAVVLGGTSAVGHSIVEALAAGSAWESVTLVVRAQTEGHARTDFGKIAGGEKIAIRGLGSLDDLNQLESELMDFDAMFCSLGAYMKLDGPEAVQHVDFGYVVAAADLAQRCGIRSFSLVSAGGADAGLPEDAKGFKFYLRTKGCADKAVLEKGIPRVYVYRPGILFGRFSSKGTASTRSKGNWDKFVAGFGCCCCCLVRSAGVHVRRLAEVMVSKAEAADTDCKVIIDNSAIHAHRA